jgi:hypothetical protein
MSSIPLSSSIGLPAIPLALQLSAGAHVLDAQNHLTNLTKQRLKEQQHEQQRIKEQQRLEEQQQQQRLKEQQKKQQEEKRMDHIICCTKESMGIAIHQTDAGERQEAMLVTSFVELAIAEGNSLAIVQELVRARTASSAAPFAASAASAADKKTDEKKTVGMNGKSILHTLNGKNILHFAPEEKKNLSVAALKEMQLEITAQLDEVKRLLILATQNCMECRSSKASITVFPCHHKVCGGCMDKLNTGGNTSCRACDTKIVKYEVLPIVPAAVVHAKPNEADNTKSNNPVTVLGRTRSRSRSRDRTQGRYRNHRSSSRRSVSPASSSRHRR